jgi:integrase
MGEGLPPPVVRGIENRRHVRRDGTVYWTFRVRYTDPGGKRAGEEFDTQDDAIDFRAARRLARRHGSLHDYDRGRSTLAEFFVSEYWPKYAAKNLAKNTLPGYASTWNNYLLPLIGSIECRHFDAPAAQQLREDLETADCVSCAGAGSIPARRRGDPPRVCHSCAGRAVPGVPTVRKALAIAQSVCRYAVARGEMRANAVREIEKPVVERQLAIVAISPLQVERLRAELDPGSALLVSLLAYEAARPEEALALEERHIGKRTLLVEQKNVNGSIVVGLKRRRKGRSRDDRHPDLWAPVRQDLAEYRLATKLERRPDRDGRHLLFPRPDGEPWTATDYRNWRRRVFKPAVARAAVAITRPYDLRHACASLLIRAGWPLTEVADFMGHTVQTLSQDYAHVIKEMKGQPAVEPAEAIQAARTRLARRSA